MSEQRTEQPTQRRLEKSRKDGQFPVSKDFASAIVFLVFVWLVQSQGANVFAGGRRMMRRLIEQAFTTELTATLLERWVLQWTWQYFSMFFVAGIGLCLLTIAMQLGMTGMGLNWSKLGPDLTRINPGPRLTQLPSQNFSTLMQSLFLVPFFTWVVFQIGQSHWNELMALPRMSLDRGLGQAASSLSGLLWKAAWAFFLLGCIDLIRQRKRWMGRLRMTKQEVRQEHKETEGNPLIRMRIRRLQREALRRQMLQQVAKLTAVIVNPTHYAVAIRYQVGFSGAPLVVAKGKDWLALSIRDIAVRNQVPIIENAPLARALHSSAEVGQEIPAHLYQAVAEVLAYIYRLMRGNLPG